MRKLIKIVGDVTECNGEELCDFRKDKGCLVQVFGVRQGCEMYL